MPRALSSGFINSLEAQEGDDVPLIFLTLMHYELIEPLRVVNDVVDYILGGTRFMAMPFQITQMSDEEGPPTGQVSVPNVDKRIGEWFLLIGSPPRVKLEIYSLLDFGSVEFIEGEKTRQPLGEPTREYLADHLVLREVQCDVETVSGTLDVYDPSAEAYPSMRATRGLTPGLFR